MSVMSSLRRRLDRDLVETARKQTWVYDRYLERRRQTAERRVARTFESFASRLAERQQDLPPGMAQMIEEHFHELFKREM